MTTSHDFKASDGIGPKVIAAWRDGGTVLDIARRFGKTEGVISGVLTRAKCARMIWKGREGDVFNELDSVTFEGLVKRGKTPDEAGELLGKKPGAAKAHARGLGLIDRKPALAGAALRSAQDQIELAKTDRPELIGGEARTQIEGDARLVAALVAQGGFNRYDDGFDWLLDMGDNRVLPISDAAKAEFLDAMRAKHGASVIAVVAA